MHDQTAQERTKALQILAMQLDDFGAYAGSACANPGATRTFAGAARTFAGAAGAGEIRQPVAGSASRLANRRRDRIQAFRAAGI
jgi:hypothetical protein